MKLEYFLMSIFLFPSIAHANCWDKMKATANQLQEVVQAQDSTKQSLITIRRNAQDWKNLLLRGSNEKDRQIMYQRFNDQKIAYEADLMNLKTQLISLNIQPEAIKILESQKTELFEKYDNALARFGVSSLDAASSADRLVQGGDVQTFRVLENLDKDLSIRVHKSFELLRSEIDKCAKE
jgi:methyl-accepting chemotaxis protein